jgi:hypothetical protein
MKGEGGVLNAWRERGLFVLVAAAFVGEVLLTTLAPRPDAAGAGVAGLHEKDQRWHRARGTLALPADAGAVFAGAEPGAYFDCSLRRVWVEPKVEVVKQVLLLDPPPPTVPAPPMLLPLPGPTLEASAGLRRWPEMPAMAVGGTEEAKGAAGAKE